MITFPIPFYDLDTIDHNDLSENNLFNQDKLREEIITKALNKHSTGDVINAEKYYQLFFDKGFLTRWLLIILELFFRTLGD